MNAHDWEAPREMAKRDRAFKRSREKAGHKDDGCPVCNRHHSPYYDCWLPTDPGYDPDEHRRLLRRSR